MNKYINKFLYLVLIAVQLVFSSFALPLSNYEIKENISDCCKENTSSDCCNDDAENADQDGCTHSCCSNNTPSGKSYSPYNAQSVTIKKTEAKGSILEHKTTHNFISFTHEIYKISSLYHTNFKELITTSTTILYCIWRC